MVYYSQRREQWLVVQVVEWKQSLINGMIRKLKVSLTPAGLKPLHFWCIFLEEIFVCAGLKKNKEDFEQQLENIGSIREMQMKESEISGKISGLEKKIQYAEIEKVTTNLSFLRWVVSYILLTVVKRTLIGIRMPYSSTHFIFPSARRSCHYSEYTNWGICLTEKYQRQTSTAWARGAEYHWRNWSHKTWTL